MPIDLTSDIPVHDTLPPSGFFDPPPRQRARIFRAMSDSAESLLSIAVEHDIALEALVCWLARPDIQEALRGFESVACLHARLGAMNMLPRMLNVLHEMARGFEYEETHHVVGTSLPAVAHRDRQRTTALRAITLMRSIALITPPPPHTSAQHPATSDLNPRHDSHKHRKPNTSTAAPPASNSSPDTSASCTPSLPPPNQSHLEHLAGTLNTNGAHIPAAAPSRTS